MEIFEVIEEIVLAYSRCDKYVCGNCPHENGCLEVFGKVEIEQEIIELAQQCKAFNRFARTNSKE